MVWKGERYRHKLASRGVRSSKIKEYKLPSHITSITEGNTIKFINLNNGNTVMISKGKLMNKTDYKNIDKFLTDLLNALA